MVYYRILARLKSKRFFNLISFTLQGGIKKYDYNFRSIRDNLYKVFGTYSLIAILSPSFRNVPFNGIEWSYQLKDLGFNEKGELSTNDFDEESLNEDEESKGEELEMSEITHKGGSKKVREQSDLDSIDTNIDL